MRGASLADPLCARLAERLGFSELPPTLGAALQRLGLVGVGSSTDDRPRAYVVKDPAGEVSASLTPGLETLEFLQCSQPVAHRLVTRDRPLRPGSSISAVAGVTGTLTACVRKRGKSPSYLLSCEHVLRQRPGEIRIAQPGGADGYWDGRRDVVAGFVSDGGLLAGSGLDAAIAKLNRSVVSQNLMYGIDRRLNSVGTAAVGDAVYMFGRTSGESRGVVTDPAVDMRIAYPDYGGRRLLLGNLMQASYACSPGDSGAPVIDEATGSLVGMHVAGSDGIGLFCKAQVVFDALGLELI